MSRSADQRISGGAESVVDVVADERRVRILDDWLKEVADHLVVYQSCQEITDVNNCITNSQKGSKVLNYFCDFSLLMKV